MKRMGLLLSGLLALCAGCGTWNDVIVHFETKSFRCLNDPNEMLTALKSELPADVEIEHFLWRTKPEAMRGIVLVKNGKVGRVVCDAVRRHPELYPAYGELQGAYAGEFMVCISSQPPFMPASDAEVLEDLRRGLPPRIRIAIDGSRRKEEGFTIWATVHGNFGKEAVKFACRHNPNLKLLQVEDSTVFLRLLFRTTGGRAKGPK